MAEEKLTWRENALGDLEAVNERGEIVMTQKAKTHYSDGKPVNRKGGPGKGRPRKKDLETHHWMMTPEGKKIWVPKGTNPDHLPRKVWPISQTMDDMILGLVCEGHTVREIGAMEGYPPSSTIFLWLRTRPEFRAQFHEARKLRAEAYHDKALAAADGEDLHEKAVPFRRLKFDAYKWGAKVNDPGSFGDSLKHTGDANNPVAWVIGTGVPQPEPIEVKPEKVETPTNE
jgi:hypothetical protein